MGYFILFIIGLIVFAIILSNSDKITKSHLVLIGIFLFFLFAPLLNAYLILFIILFGLYLFFRPDTKTKVDKFLNEVKEEFKK